MNSYRPEQSRMADTQRVSVKLYTGYVLNAKNELVKDTKHTQQTSPNRSRRLSAKEGRMFIHRSSHTKDLKNGRDGLHHWCLGIKKCM